MFLGHFGVGFAAKPLAKRCSLGTLFLAAQFIDLVWPVLLILGIERVQIDPGNTAFTPLNFIHYPYTHSLLGVLIWALLVGGIYYFVRKNLKVSLLLSGLVVSHWLLDLLVHRPDLPLDFWTTHTVGLGLWNSVASTLAIEGLIFLAGVVIYARATRATGRAGKYGFLALVVFLAVVYLLNVFGPPPDNVTAIGYVGLSQWLLIAWAYWIDRHRTSRSASPQHT